MSNHKLTLEAVEADFAAWRNNKSSPSQKIPKDLWQKIKILLQSHKHSTVFSKLRVTTEQARDNGILPPLTTIEHTTNPFVNITIPKKIMETGLLAVTPEITIIKEETNCTISNPTLEQLQLIIDTFTR